MFDAHIVPSFEHWAASSPAASSPPDQNCTHAQWTCGSEATLLAHTGSTTVTHCAGGFFRWSILLTCFPGLWLWIHTQLSWKASLRKLPPPGPRTASWCSHRRMTDNYQNIWKTTWENSFKLGEVLGRGASQDMARLAGVSETGLVGNCSELAEGHTVLFHHLCLICICRPCCCTVRY